MKIKELIKLYIAGKIRRENFKLLKESVSSYSDNELDYILEDLWFETQPKQMDERMKAGVKLSLDKTLNRSQKRILNWRKMAVSILLPVLLLTTSYLFVTSDFFRDEQKLIVFSDKGQKTQIYLPDGTKVWLNSNTSLTYSSNFNRGNRCLKLDGEAFFDVTENKSMPFIVETSGISVVVHGTAFNVCAYDSDSIISVSLNRGAVEVKNDLNEKSLAFLQPDQQLLINKRALSVQLLDCDAELHSLWTQNKLKIEDLGAEQLFRRMENWYGVNIHVENINYSDRYVLTIKTESLMEMLNLINKITPIKYTINGEEVHIRYVKR